MSIADGADAVRLLEEGNRLEDAGRLDDALARYDAAIRYAPTLARAHLNRGNALLAMGDAQQATDAYLAALAHDPGYAPAHYNLGNAYRRLDRRDGALAEYKMAISLKPDFSDAEVALGALFADLGQLEAAVACYRRALGIAPGYAAAHSNLGNALLELGQIDLALASYERALELDPRLDAARAGLANARQRIGQQSAAVDDDRGASTDGPQAVRRLHIGGKLRAPGWEVLNASPAPYVDHVCNANDLARFADNTFAEIYASHVVEHLDYVDELPRTLGEWNRALAPRGRLLVSVPDLDVLATLILDKRRLSEEERFTVMRMLFGGHLDRWDYHLVGLNEEFLTRFLLVAGFVSVRRVPDFGLFSDTSSMALKGVPISLNMIAEKAAAP